MTTWKSGRTTINFQMEDGSSEMGEVIVVGGRKTDNGILNVSERNSTLAASKISAKEMEEMQAASIDQALQGRLGALDPDVVGIGHEEGLFAQQSDEEYNGLLEKAIHSIYDASTNKN